MVVATSLFRGAVFIIALGSWFAVTVASMSGIQNVDKDYFDAARTLGASERQLVFQVAIPHAMPSILQGCTQAMSSSCVAIMMVYELGKILGRLRQNVCSTVCHLLYFYCCDKGAGSD